MWIYEFLTALIMISIVIMLGFGMYRGFKNLSKKKVISRANFIISVVFSGFLMFVLLIGALTKLVNLIF